MADKHEFEVFEDALAERLAPLTAAGVRTLAPYVGQFNVADFEELRERVTILFPCVFYMSGGIDVSVVNKYDDASLRLGIMVGDQNTRGGVAAARGDAQSPGVYQLLNEVRALLHRRPLVDGFTPLRLTGENPLVFAPEEGVVVYSAEYVTHTVK